MRAARCARLAPPRAHRTAAGTGSPRDAGLRRPPRGRRGDGRGGGLTTLALMAELAAAGIRLDVNGDRLVARGRRLDRKSTRLNSSHRTISYAVFCLKKKMTPLSAQALP